MPIGIPIGFHKHKYWEQNRRTTYGCNDLDYWICEHCGCPLPKPDGCKVIGCGVCGMKLCKECYEGLTGRRNHDCIS
jgi:hypothetical protein